MKNKKTFRIVLALVMTLAMLVASLPMTATAAGDVCKIGDTTYSSIESALRNANDGDVIEVLSDTTMTSTVSLEKKVEITSQNGSEITINVEGAITLGSSKNEGSTPGELIVSGNLKMTTSKPMAVLILHGTFTVKDEAHCKSSVRYFVDSEADGKAPAIINIEGGVLESTSDAKDKATIFLGGKNSQVNVSGGQLLQHSDGSYTVKMRAENGQINVTGGYVNAVNDVFAVYDPFLGKEINISGGIVEASNSNIIWAYSKCDYLTVNVSGDAVLKARKNTLKLTSPLSAINISGGTIIATEDAPLCMGWGEMNVTGGKIILEGTKKNAVMVRSEYAGDANPFPAFVNISGGLFINKNTKNSNIMTDVVEETTPINLTGGKFLYKDNIDMIIEDRISATTSNTATYEGESYFLYNCFAGAESKYAGTMDKGATVRLVDGSNGLRFSATYSSSVTQKLSAKGVVLYGMIIVPTAYLTTLDEFSVEALTEKYGADGFLDIACVSGKGVIVNDDGSVTLQAAIVNIKEENYSTSFSAVAYACVNGSYYYTAFDQSTSSATIKDVAKIALADANASYTAAEIAVLNDFAK